MNTLLVDRCAELYRKTLIEDIVPFWMKHAIDKESGAINNCLDDAGNQLSKDRYLWSQGRALWTFSALYNRIEPRDEWLDVAHGIYRYVSKHGRDLERRWVYRLDAEGNVLDPDISIYVDGFVVNGLGEYYTATSNSDVALLASDTYDNILSRLQDPGSYRIAPYSIPDGMKTLGIPMIFSFCFYNLGKAIGRPDISEVGRMYAQEILTDYYSPENDAIMEFVALGDRRFDFSCGRVCIPGHVIEAMWFLISIFEETGDSTSVARCCELIKKHLELGWDEEYGGIRLAIDVDGREPVEWQKPDCKPWWVQVEALVATAYAYLHTGSEWSLDWHKKVQQYAYSHYPVPTGEWTQWLDRYGNKAETAALPVKDPFHLPRGLIYLMDLFERRIPKWMVADEST
ncbi:MAG: AGE family epimerase/isomerase [Armatimonadetes bacterium]|nr:AGE family epimerase/isomerase [Armatimonadota bacterium]